MDKFPIGWLEVQACEMNSAIKQYLSRIGRKGGAAGHGQAKARSSAQMRRAALIRWGKQKRSLANVAQPAGERKQTNRQPASTGGSKKRVSNEHGRKQVKT